jgi:hypothetical protein
MSKYDARHGRACPACGAEALRRGEGPAIHVLAAAEKDVDARHKAGHDDFLCGTSPKLGLASAGLIR